MKTAMLLCFLAGLSAAELFQITVLTGEPDRYGHLLADLDELERTHFRVSRGFSATIDVEGIYCQAFSGPLGRDELGEVFTAGTRGVFTESDSEPVEIGSFLCSRDRDNLEGPGLRAPTVDGNSSPHPNSQMRSVVVQFRTGFSNFTADEVPLNELSATAPSRLGGSVVEAMVVSAGSEGIACRLFEDEQGQHKLGEDFSMHGRSYGSNPITVRAIRCQTP